MRLVKTTRGAMFSFIILVSMVQFSSSAVHRTNLKIRTIRDTAEQTTASCVCVPYYYCNSDNIVITNGEGLIDIRSARNYPRLNSDSETMCEDYLEVCCNLPRPADDSPKCGLRHNHRLQQHIPRLNKDGAEEGEFPWMVTIFRTKTVQLNNETKEIKVYQCQGSLISEKVVLTAAQCIKQSNESGNDSEPLSIRAGQLDTMMEDEDLTYQEREVEKQIIHRKYNPIRLKNNVALLVLRTPVTINRYVDITCLAHRSNIFDENKCLVIGWDQYLGPEDAKTQRVQSNILKRRSEPHVQTANCTTYLRNTPLGRQFKLDNSSICAGGPSSKNFCSGEIGGPLACPLKSDPERFVQVGVASWCIHAGNLQTPSIFASVAQVRGWIDSQMVKLRLDATVYRATNH